MDSENDEEEVVPYKTKYRQLKSRLKYLIYVSVVAFSNPSIASSGFGHRSTSASKTTFRRLR